MTKETPAAITNQTIHVNKEYANESVSRFIRIKWGRFDMRVQRLVCGNPGGITIFYSRRADFKVKAGIQIFWEDVMHHLGNKQVISYYTF